MVKSVAFSSDGKQLASGSYGKVNLWNTSNWKPKALNGSYGQVNSIAFRPTKKIKTLGKKMKEEQEKQQYTDITIITEE